MDILFLYILGRLVFPNFFLHHDKTESTFGSNSRFFFGHEFFILLFFFFFFCFGRAWRTRFYFRFLILLSWQAQHKTTALPIQFGFSPLSYCNSGCSNSIASDGWDTKKKSRFFAIRVGRMGFIERKFFTFFGKAFKGQWKGSFLFCFFLLVHLLVSNNCTGCSNLPFGGERHIGFNGSGVRVTFFLFCVRKLFNLNTLYARPIRKKKKKRDTDASYIDLCPLHGDVFCLPVADEV